MCERDSDRPRLKKTCDVDREVTPIAVKSGGLLRETVRTMAILYKPPICGLEWTELRDFSDVLHAAELFNGAHMFGLSRLQPTSTSTSTDMLFNPRDISR